MSGFKEININGEIYFRTSYYNSFVKSRGLWKPTGKIFYNDCLLCKNDMTILTFCNNNDFSFYFISNLLDVCEKYTSSSNVVNVVTFDLIKKHISGEGTIYIKFDNKKVTAKLKMMLE